MFGEDGLNAAWNLLSRLFYFGTLIQEDHREQVVVGLSSDDLFFFLLVLVRLAGVDDLPFGLLLDIQRFRPAPTFVI